MYNYMAIEITKRCNLSCKYCYAQANQTTVDIDTNRLCSFIERYVQAGGKSVLFTGGEIFLHADIEKIIVFAHQCGLLINIFTNGILLNSNWISFIQKYVNRVNISIDGPKETHDNLCGVPESYQRVVDAIYMLHKNKIKFLLQTMLVPQNIENLDWLVTIIKDTEPEIVRLSHINIVGRGATAQEYALGNNIVQAVQSASDNLSAKTHYHTRIVNNIITQRLKRTFYADFQSTMYPWMLPDGKILSCYCNEYSEYWKISDIDNYPIILPYATKRLHELHELLMEKTTTLPHFDLFELISTIGYDIAKKQNYLQGGEV